MSNCKGCRESVHISDKKIIKMISQLQDSGIELANNKLYETRINICQTCPALQYETTCRYSGMLVRIKAKVLARSCSHPENPTW